MILTENICKLIFNLAWDSACSSRKHHGFIHVEIPACSYVYMHITTNSPFLCPIFSCHWEDQVSGYAEPLQTAQNQPGCFTVQILSWLPSLLAQNPFAAIMWLTAIIAKAFLSLSKKKKIKKCIASIRCSRTFAGSYINACISGVTKIPNFWLLQPESGCWSFSKSASLNMWL